MGYAQDLVNAGYIGYQGWGDTEALADYNATGGAGKIPGGGGGSGGGGGFSFDFEAETKKAYGELGEYYDRLLKEYKGDMNKILSRMTEDYDRGVRQKMEDATLAREDINFAENKAEKNAVANFMNRGIYGKSAFDPSGGRGVADNQMSDILRPFSRRRQDLDTSLNRYKEIYGPSGVNLTRQRADTTEGIDRKTFELEQNRRREAGELANMRADRAYRNYTSQLA